ncbi:hypothetical protein [Candidatus Mycoplasma mahonii]|uniref:hypothetical protein n=1 Tax=Candidatus Mycoplasma mahonii TaxID=3004105 RepID=UPI0026F18AD6|nr:hypothetical protein [Candidatus Mycoplasma mahonii]WKX02262.1 hypothetical protein O3I44_02560 [Candidatus Mycoplasma mahonii]
MKNRNVKVILMGSVVTVPFVALTTIGPKISSKNELDKNATPSNIMLSNHSKTKR